MRTKVSPPQRLPKTTDLVRLIVKRPPPIRSGRSGAFLISNDVPGRLPAVECVVATFENVGANFLPWWRKPLKFALAFQSCSEKFQIGANFLESTRTFFDVDSIYLHARAVFGLEASTFRISANFLEFARTLPNLVEGFLNSLQVLNSGAPFFQLPPNCQTRLQFFRFVADRLEVPSIFSDLQRGSSGMTPIFRIWANFSKQLAQLFEGGFELSNLKRKFPEWNPFFRTRRELRTVVRELFGVDLHF